MRSLRTIVFLLFSFINLSFYQVIVDANYSFEEATNYDKIPKALKKNLILINVNYFSFDGKLHKGQLVINKNVEDDIHKIFELITIAKFPVKKVVPIVHYNWNDTLSMLDNNTSAFNYRMVKGSNRLSKHSTGCAIDINPFNNPFIKRSKISPRGAIYDKNLPGTLQNKSLIVKEFKKLNWSWGGNWRSAKDYQHFEKLTGCN